jgi:hypothetical protein
MLVASDVAASRGLLSAADLDAVRSLIMQLGPLPQVADVLVSQMI